MDTNYYLITMLRLLNQRSTLIILTSFLCPSSLHDSETSRLQPAALLPITLSLLPDINFPPNVNNRTIYKIHFYRTHGRITWKDDAMDASRPSPVRIFTVVSLYFKETRSKKIHEFNWMYAVSKYIGGLWNLYT